VTSLELGNFASEVTVQTAKQQETKYLQLSQEQNQITAQHIDVCACVRICRRVASGRSPEMPLWDILAVGRGAGPQYLTQAVNPLKTEFIHSFIYKFTPYLTGNT
jgi:hypothetical protein